MNDLIWIRQDYLIDQLSSHDYNDVNYDRTYEKKIKDPNTSYYYYAFEAGTVVGSPNTKIGDLDHILHHTPASLSEKGNEPKPPSNGNNQTSSGYSIYAFFVAAAPSIWEVIRVSRGKNWDKRALTSRIEKIGENVQVIKIENLPTGLFTAPQKQANVWVKLLDMEISELTNKLIEAINHSGIQKPAIGELKKVSSTEEKPSKEGIGTKNVGIPWNIVKWIGISGLGLYGLDILLEQTNFKVRR